MTEIHVAPLAEMPAGGQYRRFSDGDVIKLHASRIDFNRCEWVNVRLKEAVFQECQLTRCRFLHCYLRGSCFTRVDLTGTKFHDCDLSKVTFSGAKLWYVEFYNCDVNYDDLIHNAPQEVNLRRRLFNSLRLNAKQRGDSRAAARLLLLEMASRRQEEWSILLASTDYFRDHFTAEDRLGSLGRWLFHWIERIVWGYGVGLLALIRSAAVLLLLVATISWFADAKYIGSNGPTSLSFSESLYAAIVAFSTVGDFTPADTLSRFIRAFLSLSGGVFLGLFAAAAYRRIKE